jgi:hypothetical protein
MRNDSLGSVEGIDPVINKDNMDPSDDQEPAERNRHGCFKTPLFAKRCYRLDHGGLLRTTLLLLLREEISPSNPAEEGWLGRGSMARKRKLPPGKGAKALILTRFMIYSMVLGSLCRNQPFKEGLPFVSFCG